MSEPARPLRKWIGIVLMLSTLGGHGYAALLSAWLPFHLFVLCIGKEAAERTANDLSTEFTWLTLLFLVLATALHFVCARYLMRAKRAFVIALALASSVAVFATGLHLYARADYLSYQATCTGWF